MTIAAIVSMPVGLLLAVSAFIWYGSWSLPAALGGIVLACLGGLYLCSLAIDRGIKDYIDYARKEKDNVRHRRT